MPGEIKWDSTSDSRGAGQAASRRDEVPLQPGVPGTNRAVDILRISRFHPLGEVYAFTAIRLRCPAGEAPTYLLYGKKSIKEDKPMHARDSP